MHNKGTIVSDRDVVVREEKDKQSKPIGFVSSFDNVKILDSSDEKWVKISTDFSLKGYVEKKWIAS